jgi:hypothetical protein
MSMTDTRDEAVQEIVESLRRPVMLHSDAAQTNAERQQAADTITTLSRQLAEAQGVIERGAGAAVHDSGCDFAEPCVGYRTLSRQLAEAQATLNRIDSINDNPARYNPESHRTYPEPGDGRGYYEEEMTPPIRQIRKLIEAVMRTHDDFLYATQDGDTLLVTLECGRKITITIRDQPE